MGGIRGIVTPKPEITTLKETEEVDFIFLACDGIFDSLTNDEVNELIWETIRSYEVRIGEGEKRDLRKDCLSDCVNNVLKKAMLEGSEDNVTIVLVMFREFFDLE